LGSEEPTDLVFWAFRFLRRHRKKARRAIATTARVAPMLIPAMAPDDRPLFEKSPLEDSASEVPEVEVSDSEAVDSEVDADVVIGCDVDEESYRLLTLTQSLRQATNFRKDGAVCSIIYILHTRHKPMLPALIPLVVGTQEDRAIGNTI
jgi:hypothetical protein